MPEDSPRPAVVAAVVLAAGASSRMGSAKQLLELEGRPLVRHVTEVALAAGCAPVLVVVGAGSERVRAALSGLPIEVIQHAGWQAGQGSSLRVGVQALPAHVRAVVVLLCDQPAVTKALLESLETTWRTSAKSVVACRYGQVLGPPALFSREAFAELTSLEGDTGARGFLKRAGTAVATVDFPEGAFDLDTPEDWARWRARA